MIKIKDIFKCAKEVDKRVLAVRRMEKKMEMYRKLYAIKAEKAAVSA